MVTRSAEEEDHGDVDKREYQFRPSESVHEVTSSPSPVSSSIKNTWDCPEDSEPHSETNTTNLSQSEDKERDLSPSSSVAQTVDDSVEHDRQGYSASASNKSSPGHTPVSSNGYIHAEIETNIHTRAETNSHGDVDISKSSPDADIAKSSPNHDHADINNSSPRTLPVDVEKSASGTDQNENSDVTITITHSTKSSIPAIAEKVLTAAKKNVHMPKWSFAPKKAHGFKSPKSFKAVQYNKGKVLEVILRIGCIVLSLIAFAVMAATSEVQSGAGSTFNMKFTDYGAYNYLVAINVITFVYSIYQMILLVRGTKKIETTMHDSKLLFIFAADQVLAFLHFSASTSGATAAQLSRHGLRHIWPPACSTWKLWVFCSKADAAVVMSFFCSFCVIASALFSGYHLSRNPQQFG